MRMMLLLSIGALVGCDTSESALPEIFAENSVAMMGYDPVAYFTASDAILGDEANAVDMNGVAYYFTSKENQELFEKNPEKYLPSYGGWCAYAVAESATKMVPDPTNWQIQDGELQFFVANWQTKLMGSLKDEWNQTPDHYKSKADENWEALK